LSDIKFITLVKLINHNITSDFSLSLSSLNIRPLDFNLTKKKLFLNIRSSTNFYMHLWFFFVLFWNTLLITPSASNYKPLWEKNRPKLYVVLQYQTIYYSFYYTFNYLLLSFFQFFNLYFSYYLLSITL